MTISGWLSEAPSVMLRVSKRTLEGCKGEQLGRRMPHPSDARDEGDASSVGCKGKQPIEQKRKQWDELELPRRG